MNAEPTVKMTIEKITTKLTMVNNIFILFFLLVSFIGILNYTISNF